MTWSASATWRRVISSHTCDPSCWAGRAPDDSGRERRNGGRVRPRPRAAAGPGVRQRRRPTAHPGPRAAAHRRAQRRQRVRPGARLQSSARSRGVRAGGAGLHLGRLRGRRRARPRRRAGGPDNRAGRAAGAVLRVDRSDQAGALHRRAAGRLRARPPALAARPVPLVPGPAGGPGLLVGHAGHVAAAR